MVGSGLLTGIRHLIADCTIFDVGTSGIQLNGVTDVTVRDCFVHTTTQKGIDMIGECENIVVSGCHIKGTAQAGIVAAGLHIDVSGNTIEDSGASGDNITGYGETNKYVVITNNVCIDSLNHGIHMGGEGIVVANNHIFDPVNDGVFLENTNDSLSAINSFTVTGNRIKSARNGINVTNGRKGTISGNTIDLSSAQGIQLTDCQDLAVSGNVASGSTDKGFRVAGTIDSAFTGNVIASNGSHGIQLLDGTAGCLSNVISGNNIKDNTGTGIFFSGAEANNYVHGNSLFGNATSLGACDPTTNAVSNYVSDNNLESVAAAASVTLPTTGNSIVITDTSGPVTINTIVNSFAGRVVTLMFSNSVATVVGDGTGNVYLSGTFTASGTHNDTLTLLSNGTNGWIEVSRSAN